MNTLRAIAHSIPLMPQNQLFIGKARITRMARK